MLRMYRVHIQERTLSQTEHAAASNPGQEKPSSLSIGKSVSLLAPELYIVVTERGGEARRSLPSEVAGQRSRWHDHAWCWSNAKGYSMLKKGFTLCVHPC